MNDLFGVRGFKEPTPLGKPITPNSGGKSASCSTNASPYSTITKALWDRKRVIRRNAGLPPIPGTETKLISILVELSSGINVREATIAAGILVRFVLERSVEYYAKKNKDVVIYDGDKLHKRIKKVAEKMKKVGKIDQKQFEQLSKMSQSEELISAHTLNAWVHSNTYIPTPREVCTFWDNIHFFLVECWK
jgi:hypothetical protein